MFLLVANSYYSYHELVVRAQVPLFVKLGDAFCRDLALSLRDEWSAPCDIIVEQHEVRLQRLRSNEIIWYFELFGRSRIIRPRSWSI